MNIRRIVFNVNSGHTMTELEYTHHNKEAMVWILLGAYIFLQCVCSLALALAKEDLFPIKEHCQAL